MKRGILFLSAVFIIVFSGLVLGYCIDSDGGSNIFLKGTVSIFLNGTVSDPLNKTDFCINDKEVFEYKCHPRPGVGQGFVAQGSSFNCPEDSYCLDGACVVEPYCTDSDGGVNYNVKGSTTSYGYLTEYEELTREDFCFITTEPTGGNTFGYTIKVDECESCELNEYYCGSEKGFESEQYLCPNGCRNGACDPSCKEN